MAERGLAGNDRERDGGEHDGRQDQRWLTADWKAPFWPESSESISMKPVTGLKK